MIEDDVIREVLDILDKGRMETIGLVMSPRQALFLYTVFLDVERRYRTVGQASPAIRELATLRDTMEEILSRGGITAGQIARIQLLMEPPI